MRKNIKFTVPAALLLSLFLTLCGCGKSGDTGGFTPTKTAPPQKTAAPLKTAAPEKTAKPQSTPYNTEGGEKKKQGIHGTAPSYFSKTAAPQNADSPKKTDAPKSTPYKTESKTAKTPSPKTEDPYDVNDFSNADDFYDEHYDDFFDYEDAESYFDEHHEE